MRKRKNQTVYLRLCCHCHSIYLSDDKKCPTCVQKKWQKWFVWHKNHRRKLEKEVYDVPKK